MSARTNHSPITAKERDAIVAMLRVDPFDLAGPAAKFSRSENTIRRLRARANVLRHRQVIGLAIAEQAGRGR